MNRPAVAALAGALVLASAVSACSGGGDQADSPDGTTTTEAPTPDTGTTDHLEAVQLGLETVATLDEPIALAQRPGTNDLYVAEKGGTVRRITVTSRDDHADLAPRYDLDDTPVLDISDDVVNQGEQGLLGLAFSSDGRLLYLDYTRRSDGDTIVEEVDLGDDDRAGDDDRRQVLHVEQPAANHNGGQLVFGPDGYLYIGLGDGGGAGDPDNTGQNPLDLLGSILRIDPDPDSPGATHLGSYAAPSGNPFSLHDGQTAVWLYGVRNPWRFTFDRATGDLWVADVGQGDWEEIDHLPADGEGRNAGRAANLGWSQVEGTHPYDGREDPDDDILPVFEYSHADGGCSVTGGYRYRGTAIPALAGVYLFADYCLDTIQGLQLDDAGTVIGHRAWDVPAAQVQSFGEDAAGELYLLRADGDVVRVVAGT